MKTMNTKSLLGASRAIFGRPATEKELCHPVRLAVGILTPLIRTRPQHNTDFSENTFAVTLATNKNKTKRKQQNMKK